MTKPTFLVRNSYNANKDEITIYTPDGRPQKATRANARDLLRMGYTTKPNTKVEPTPPEPEPVKSRIVVVEDTFDAPPITPTTPLMDIARKVGETSEESYLKTLTTAALRDLIELRYNVKPHHKKSKDALVIEAMQLEKARIDALPSWHPEVTDEEPALTPAPVEEAPVEEPAEVPSEEPSKE